METFSALLALCEGNPPITGGFPSQRPVTQSFDIFFDLPEQTAEQTIEAPVIWDSIAPFMTPRYVNNIVHSVSTMLNHLGLFHSHQGNHMIAPQIPVKQT